MEKRKQYVIDKDFQKGHAMSVLKWTLIFIFIISAIIGINVVFNSYTLENVRIENDTIIENLGQVMEKSDNMVEALITWSLNPKKKPGGESVKEVAIGHLNNLNIMKDNIGSIKKNISKQNSIVRYNYILLIAILLIIIIQGLLLYRVLIRKTHKISGPIYVMSNYMKDIIEGKDIPDIRPLREDDELKDFYEIFKQLIDVMKKVKGQ